MFEPGRERVLLQVCWYQTFALVPQRVEPLVSGGLLRGATGPRLCQTTESAGMPSATRFRRANAGPFYDRDASPLAYLYGSHSRRLATCQVSPMGSVPRGWKPALPDRFGAYSPPERWPHYCKWGWWCSGSFFVTIAHRRKVHRRQASATAGSGMSLRGVVGLGKTYKPARGCHQPSSMGPAT